MDDTASSPYRVVLVSTYELGHQPFGLASAAAWIGETGASVRCLDLSRESRRDSDFLEADFIGFHVPMHTATRLAAALIPRVAHLNPSAHLCAFGLYASMNADYLQTLGVNSVLGGEFEQDLAELVARSIRHEPASSFVSALSLRRQHFLVPDRKSLPALSRYSKLHLPSGVTRVSGYTEASRGCKHLCRHCPIVPVYNGRFRIVQPAVVLEDVKRQVQSGAEHITFGDPDFFNGIGHAISLVTAFREQFPGVTFDVTIKIEHLLQYSNHLETLRQCGCAFVTSAVESVDDEILRILDKRHTRSDFVRVVELCRRVELPLVPTFVSFTPWLTLQGYEQLLQLIAELEILEWVSPVQWAIRLLVPQGSRLLELPEMRNVITGFDRASLSYQWDHPDRRMDDLHHNVEELVRQFTQRPIGRADFFTSVWRLVRQAQGDTSSLCPAQPPLASRCTIPYLTEPWYC